MFFSPSLLNAELVLMTSAIRHWNIEMILVYTGRNDFSII